MDRKIVVAAMRAFNEKARTKFTDMGFPYLDNLDEAIVAALDAALSAGLCGERERDLMEARLARDNYKRELLRYYDGHSSTDREAAIRREALEEAAREANAYGKEQDDAVSRLIWTRTQFTSEYRNRANGAYAVECRIRALIATPDKGGANG